MLRLRPYKPCDAEIIASWVKDERTCRRWCSDRYENYPVTGADINRKYIDNNGDCAEPDNFYPMTAIDESGTPVGHLILRFTDMENRVLRFGFVVVDDSKRGKGYGKEMMTLALKYAFEILKVSKVTIGVFENNPAAYFCYKAAGFRDVEGYEQPCYDFHGEQWKCLELEAQI